MWHILCCTINTGMIDPISTMMSVWLVTVTVQFKEIDQHFSTYNKTIYFNSKQKCDAVLDKGFDFFNESFTEYWNQETHGLEEYTIKDYGFDCIEWYSTPDGEWYMVGTEPSITI